MRDTRTLGAILALVLLTPGAAAQSGDVATTFAAPQPKFGQWELEQHADPMSDRVSYALRHEGNEDSGPIWLSWDCRGDDTAQVLVANHTDPGRGLRVRVDQGVALMVFQKVPRRGIDTMMEMLKNQRALDKELTLGKVLRIEFYKWPGGPKWIDIDLEGVAAGRAEVQGRLAPCRHAP